MWCAGAEISEPCKYWLMLLISRAGTPEWKFAPLVTPYGKLFVDRCQLGA